MVPTHYAAINPSLNNVISDLSQSLWWEYAGDFAQLFSSRYDVVYPERMIVQCAHKQADAFSRPIYILGYSLNYTVGNEYLEQVLSRNPDLPNAVKIRFRTQTTTKAVPFACCFGTYLSIIEVFLKLSAVLKTEQTVQKREVISNPQLTPYSSWKKGGATRE